MNQEDGDVILQPHLSPDPSELHNIKVDMGSSVQGCEVLAFAFPTSFSPPSSLPMLPSDTPLSSQSTNILIPQ